MLGAQILEILLEECSHLDDAVGHALDLTEPLLVQAGIVQDLARDTGAVDRRVRVERTDEDLDLRVDALLLFGRVADDAEGADTLAVQTHVLGEGLRQHETVALLDEQADRVGVLVGVAGCEALVGHVEKRIVFLLLDHVADLAPLLGSGVDAGRVVGAGVQEDDRARGGGLEVGDHAVKVESDGVFVVVLVLLDLQARVGEDGLVVRPRWGRDVDGLRARVEALQKGAAYSQRSRAGDGLGDGDAVFLEWFGVWAVGQESGGFGEGGNARDAGVFFVEFGVDHLFFGRAD